MAERNEIDRLQGRLRQEATGPLEEISNQVTTSLLAAVRDVTQWLRQAGEEKPLISLLIAFELGFAVGRWGGRRAQH